MARVAVMMTAIEDFMYAEVPVAPTIFRTQKAPGSILLTTNLVYRLEVTLPF